MKSIIYQIAQETRVRDREGNAIYTITGSLFTLILRLIIGGLFLLAIGGILGFVGMWIAGEISVSGANFGILG